MSIKLLPIITFLFGLLFFSCDTDDKSTPDKVTSVQMDDGEDIFVMTDTILFIDRDFPVQRATPYEGYSDVGLMKGFLSVRKENIWMPCEISQYWAERLGVEPDKKYYLRKEF